MTGHDHAYQSADTSSGRAMLCVCGDHATWCTCRYCTYLTNLVPEPRPSRQETRVLRFLVDGRTRREVAELMGLSVKTVDTHRYRALLKLNCRNEIVVVRWLFDLGIDEPQSPTHQAIVDRANGGVG